MSDLATKTLEHVINLLEGFVNDYQKPNRADMEKLISRCKKAIEDDIQEKMDNKNEH